MREKEKREDAILADLADGLASDQKEEEKKKTNNGVARETLASGGENRRGRGGKEGGGRAVPALSLRIRFTLDPKNVPRAMEGKEGGGGRRDRYFRIVSRKKRARPSLMSSPGQALVVEPEKGREKKRREGLVDATGPSSVRPSLSALEMREGKGKTTTEGGGNR